MKLSIWTYEGPPHVGAMRVATAMKDLHFVLHAPQGDTYADLLFTMIERGNKRPPVTYTTFQARDLGSDTADLFKKSCEEAVERFKPSALIVGASCTAELIQDDPAGLAEALGLSIPVIPLELPSYQRKENFGTDETFYQIVKSLAQDNKKTNKISCNILGPTALGFRHRDDVKEIKSILEEQGIEVNVTAPLGASPSDIRNLTKGHFNVMLYPESSELACRWLKDNFNYLKENCRLSIAVGHHPLFSSGDRDKGSPQLASFLNEYVFGVFDIYIAGHNHVLADEGEKNGTLQLISGSGSLPGGSPDQAPTDKFNVETPGYLALGIENTKSGILAKYRFISAETGETLWSKIKIGKGIRY